MTSRQIDYHVQRLAHIVSMLIDGLATHPDEENTLLIACYFCGRTSMVAATEISHQHECPATLLHDLLADIEQAQLPQPEMEAEEVALWPHKEDE